MSAKVKYVGQNQVREITINGKVYRWDAGNNKSIEIDDPRLAADLITQEGFAIDSDDPEADSTRLLDSAFPPPESQSPTSFAGKIKSRLAAKE